MTEEKSNDKKLSQTVLDELVADLEIGALNIQVNSEKGVVYLDGIVDVLSDKEEAENLAVRIGGVKEVKNRLVVAQDGVRKDKELSRIITNKLSQELDLPNIGVIVKEGRAFLKGEVKNLAEGRKALEICSQIIGVKDVISNLKKVSTDDSSIDNEINRILSGDQRVDQPSIAIEVKNGKVNLAGSVVDLEIRELIEELVAKVAGVKEINNKLITHKGGVGGDTALEEMIRRELGKADGVSPVQVKVYVVGNMVFLDGEVDSLQQHEAALKVVRNAISHVKGVQGLNNGIKVTGKKGSKSER
jgi:osmotically-inducible protein OsmY